MRKSVPLICMLLLGLSGCAGFGEGMASFARGAQEAENTMRAMGYPSGVSGVTGQPLGCSLRGESTSGMHKSCQYSCASGSFTRMVGAGQMCPMN